MDGQKDLPLGLGMALAQNASAMERFAALSPTEKQSAIDGARQVRSPREMRQYVEDIGRSE